MHITIAMMAGMLLLATLLEPLANRLKLPFMSLLVLLGYLGSELFVAIGIDTGIRADNFGEIIIELLLPILIFESAFLIEQKLLWQNIGKILFLAIPLMLLCALISAVLIYYGIDHATGFPWYAALLTGALLAATDPVSVVSLLRQCGCPERLAVIIEGESLFNDATAIVLFSVFLSAALQPEIGADPIIAVQRFVMVFFGGIIVGLSVAGLAMLILGWIQYQHTQALITLVCSYAAFILAEKTLHVSGIMAVLSCGLMLSYWLRRTHKVEAFVNELWPFLAYIANAFVFILMGVTVTIDMFSERWLAIIIAIVAVLASRFIGNMILLPVVSSADPINWQQRVIMSWGGLRGGVTLALALSIPVELPYWWTIQSIAFGVVMFTLFVQAPSMPYLIKKLDV